MRLYNKLILEVKDMTGINPKTAEYWKGDIMTKETGGQAFPKNGSLQDANCYGMTLRDYFAGQAVIGAITNKAVLEELSKLEIKNCEKYGTRLAKLSYAIADAMIKERRDYETY